MSNLGANFGRGKNKTVYHFIRELIQEGKYAWFVNQEGRFRIKWEDAVKLYIQYRAKKNPRYDLNIDRKKASNSFREGLLRRYCDDADGAKEYEECQKVGEKNKVVEREFQMPSKVFHSLFGSSVELPGDQVDKKLQVSPDVGTSLDTSNTDFEEAMNVSDASVGNIKGEDTVVPSNMETPLQIFGLSTKDLDSALDENSDNDVDQAGVVQNISPSAGFVKSEKSGISVSDPELTQDNCHRKSSPIGSSDELPGDKSETSGISVSDPELTQEDQSLLQSLENLDYKVFMKPKESPLEGGYPFRVSFCPRLDTNVTSVHAVFVKSEVILGNVELVISPSVLFGHSIPGAPSSGWANVIFIDQNDTRLGSTEIFYFPDGREVVALVKIPSLFENLCEEMRCHTASSFDGDDGDPQRYGAFGDAQQVQLLHLLIDTAAREGAQQFIEMIFSTSAGRLVFDASKDSRSLPEVVARYHGHNKTACYLEGVTKRFSVEISATKECPKKINWSELAQAAAGEAQKCNAENESCHLMSDLSKDAGYLGDLDTSSSEPHSSGSEDDISIASKKECNTENESGDLTSDLSKDAVYLGDLETSKEPQSSDSQDDISILSNEVNEDENLARVMNLEVVDVHDVQSLQDTEVAEKFQEKAEVMFPKIREAVQCHPTGVDRLDNVRMEGKISDISAKDSDWAQEEISTNSHNDTDQLTVVQDTSPSSGSVKIFDISAEDLGSALEEICINSDNDVDQPGVVQDIFPSSGSMKISGICTKDLDSTQEETCTNSDTDVDQRGVIEDISPSSGSVKKSKEHVDWDRIRPQTIKLTTPAKSGDEEDFRGMPSHEGDTSSDYFADARTSSCVSFEVDSGRSDSEAGSKDKEPEKELTRNAALSSGTFTKDREPTEKESPTLTPPVEPSSNETTQFDQAEDEEKTHFRSSRFHMFKSLITVTVPTYFSHGVTKHASGDLSSALQSKHCALDITHKLFEEEDPDTAQSYFSHGVTQHASGDLLSALQLFQRALDIRVKIFGEEHPDTSHSYFRLGVTQHDSGKLSSALKSLQRALDIRVKIFGEEHPYTSHSYFRLGVTQHDLGDLSSALQSLQRALDIRVKIFGEEHPDTALSYRTLGVTQYASGDLSSALQSKQRALCIRVKLFGEEHPDIAQSYFSLGVTQHALGYLLSALQSFQRALHIRVKIFGEEHPDTARSYFRLGETQHDSGDLSSALHSLQRALDIRVKIFGEEHPDTAQSYQTLGVTQYASGDLSSARQSKQRALDIRVKLSGEDHPDIAESYFSLGVKTQDDSGDLSSALQSCQRALDIKGKIFGEDHPDTAQSYLSLGVTQHDSGDLSSALHSKQCALDIRVKLFGEEHPATAKSHFSPGVTQHAPGDPSSAL